MKLPLDPELHCGNFDDPEGWEMSCSEGESVHMDETHRVEPFACCPITKCGKSGSAGSSPLSVMEHGYKAGMQPAMCGICGMVFPRPVSFSSGLDVPSERAVISGSCVDGPSAQSVMKECRAVSHEFDGAMSFGWSGGKGTLQTSHAHLVTSQLDEGTQSAPAGPSSPLPSNFKICCPDGGSGHRDTFRNPNVTLSDFDICHDASLIMSHNCDSCVNGRHPVEQVSKPCRDLCFFCW